MTASIGSDPITLITFLAALALLPLAFIVGTSFLKLSIVLMVVRNAIGVQQVPPQIALYALALAMTGFIMAPTASQMIDLGKTEPFANENTAEKLESLSKVLEPWKRYLSRNANEESVDTFLRIARKHWPPEYSTEVQENNIFILLPAFTVSELKQAFEIGFLIYVPFIVIDIVVSNILLALGMQMVAPMTFSTPLKLLLFISVDGWNKLLSALAAAAA